MTCYRSRQTHPPPIIPRQMAKRNESIKRLRNTSEYSLTTFKTTGLNGYPSQHLLTITAYTPPPVKAPSRLTTAITLTSSLAPNPRHPSGCLHPPPLFQKCRKSMKRPNKLWKKPPAQMKAQYDKKKRPAIEYQVGDKVWLDTTNLNLPRPKKKLDDKRTGPFLIISKKELQRIP